MSDLSIVTAAATRVSAKYARDERLKREATETFAHHEIRHRTEQSVVIMKPHPKGGFSSDYCAEILAGHFNFLTVLGDCQTVVFYGHGGPLRSRIAWIGAHTDVSYYVRQKASIGLGFDVDEFVPELVDDLKHALTEDVDAARAAELRAVIDHAMLCEEEPVNAIIRELGEANVSDAWEYHSLLVAPKARIYYAWAACRRALELLDAADAAAQQAAREVSKASSEVVADSTPIAPTNPETGLGGDHG
jgi:hypothetical protein